MTLLAILLGTLGAGIGSVWLAALLSFGLLARYTQHMLSLAAGALMATAFMHLLPEAFESGIAPHHLFLILLIGLVFFFLLDKAELWHHGHEHGHGHGHGHGHEDGHGHGDDHLHDHDHPHAQGQAHHHVHHHTNTTDTDTDTTTNHNTRTSSGAWAVLAGDSVHCFGDGMLIASAFIADLHLGLIAALAVLAHEVPHHMGDLMVLRASTTSKRAALTKVSLAGAVTALGGVVGYWLVEQLSAYLPYFLVVAASSFVYVALADLIPQLQKRLSATQTLAQIAWLLSGMGAVIVVGLLAHG